MAGSCGFVLMLLYVVYDLPANPLDPSYVPFWKRFLRRFFEVRSFGRNLGKFERVFGDILRDFGIFDGYLWQTSAARWAGTR